MHVQATKFALDFTSLILPLSLKNIYYNKAKLTEDKTVSYFTSKMGLFGVAENCNWEQLRYGKTASMSREQKRGGSFIEKRGRVGELF